MSRSHRAGPLLIMRRPRSPGVRRSDRVNSRPYTIFVIGSARTGTLSAVKIRSYRLHLSVALHCALLGPVACGDKSDETTTASMTEASTTGGTTTPDPTTTGATLDSTTTTDPTTESAPTTDATSTTGEPPSAVCESFCATHDVCCTPDAQCQFDAACVETCERALRDGELRSPNCRALYEDAHSCAAADCTTFIEYEVLFEGECWDQQEAAWNDPSCFVPTPPECVSACANIAACDPELETEKCESECDADIFDAKLDRDLACEQALKEVYTCIAGLTCEQADKGEGCDPLPKGCG